MSVVLVTGARGFVGRACLGPLLERGHEVHGLCRSSAGERPLASDVTWHALDLLAEDASALLARVRPERLLHLAWIATPGVYWTSPDNERHREAGERLFAAFEAGGGSRIVAIGTGAEYDWSAGHCQEGQTALHPTSPYTIAKDALRRALLERAVAGGPSAAWARVFWPYGPFEHPRRLLPQLIRGLLRGETVACGPGEKLRDFLYVADAGEALVELLLSDVTGEVNIASGVPTSIAELAALVEAELEAPGSVRLGERPDPTPEPPLVVADVTRLREEVGFTPGVSLAAGVAASIDWWKEQPA